MGNGYYGTQNAGAMLQGFMTSYNRSLNMQANIAQHDLANKRYDTQMAMQKEQYAAQDARAEQQMTLSEENNAYNKKIKGIGINLDLYGERQELENAIATEEMTINQNPYYDNGRLNQMKQRLADFDQMSSGIRSDLGISKGSPQPADTTIPSRLGIMGSSQRVSGITNPQPPAASSGTIPQRIGGSHMSPEYYQNIPDETAEGVPYMKYRGQTFDISYDDFGRPTRGKPMVINKTSGMETDNPTPTPVESKTTATEAISATETDDPLAITAKVLKSKPSSWFKEKETSTRIADITSWLKSGYDKMIEQHGTEGRISLEKEDDVLNAARDEVKSWDKSTEEKRVALETIDEVGGRVDPDEIVRREADMLEPGIWAKVESVLKTVDKYGALPITKTIDAVLPGRPAGEFMDRVALTSYSPGKVQDAIKSGVSYIMEQNPTRKDQIRFLGGEPHSANGQLLSDEQIRYQTEVAARSQVSSMVNRKTKGKVKDTIGGTTVGLGVTGIKKASGATSGFIKRIGNSAKKKIDEKTRDYSRPNQPYRPY